MGPTRRTLITGTAAALAAPAAFAQQSSRSANVATSAVFAPVTINGQPLRGLLDSGATGHAIDANLAARLGVRTSSRRYTTLGVGGLSRGYYSDLVDLTIAGQPFNKITVAILDLSDLSQRFGAPVEMLLGRPLFNTMVVEMDFQARAARLTERRNFTPPADARGVKLAGLMGLMTAPVSLPGGVVYGAVDTATMPGLIVSDRAAQRAGLLNDGARVSTTLLGGVAGVSEGQITSAATLSLGDESFKDVPVRITPRPVGPDAVLGLELLSRYRLWLDFGFQRMWMRKEGPQPDFPHDLLGLFGEPGPAGLRVTYVARNSPAETAGLAAGDLIAQVNGRPSVGVNVMIVNAEAGFPMSFTLADGRRLSTKLARYY